jgi:hypothetical protein
MVTKEHRLQADKACQAERMKPNSLLHRQLVQQICYYYYYYFLFFLWIICYVSKRANPDHITFVGHNLKDSHHHYVCNSWLRSNISYKLCSHVYLLTLHQISRAYLQQFIGCRYQKPAENVLSAAMLLFHIIQKTGLYTLHILRKSISIRHFRTLKSMALSHKFERPSCYYYLPAK